DVPVHKPEIQWKVYVFKYTMFGVTMGLQAKTWLTPCRHQQNIMMVILPLQMMSNLMRVIGKKLPTATYLVHWKDKLPMKKSSSDGGKMVKRLLNSLLMRTAILLQQFCNLVIMLC